MSASPAIGADASPRPRLVLEPRPSARRQWLAEVWGHRDLLVMLARHDFHARYKRASLGVLWAVALPLLQTVVLTVIFSRFARFEGDFVFAAYAGSGIFAWTYFNLTLVTASTAIVDGSDLADKVWFPRVLLVLVPCLAGLPALLITQGVFILALPILGVSFGAHTLLLLPAIVLLIAFTVALSSVVSALHVYFRDVRYLIQAALLLFFWLTPVFYPQRILGDLGLWFDLNPLTGVINLFHLALVGNPEAWNLGVGRSVAIAAAATAVLAVVGAEAQRRRDRLFIDLL